MDLVTLYEKIARERRLVNKTVIKSYKWMRRQPEMPLKTWKKEWNRLRKLNQKHTLQLNAYESMLREGHWPEKDLFQQLMRQSDDEAFEEGMRRLANRPTA